MPSWKRLLLTGAGFGAGFAIFTTAIIGGWIWYDSRPHAPKPWNGKAIIATFDYPDTESGPQDKGGFSPDQLVFYYTLENTTDFDYRMPSRDQLQLSGKLKEERSLTTNDQLLTLDDHPIFLPAKQRMRIGIHLQYGVKKDFGPKDSKEDRQKRRKAIADYMGTEVNNLDGFVVFDTENRYRIDFPNGWNNLDSK
jgi:hypothetical protein